jgi:hypothetical protein
MPDYCLLLAPLSNLKSQWWEAFKFKITIIYPSTNRRKWSQICQYKPQWNQPTITNYLTMNPKCRWESWWTNKITDTKIIKVIMYLEMTKLRSFRITLSVNRVIIISEWISREINFHKEGNHTRLCSHRVINHLWQRLRKFIKQMIIC